MPKRVKFLRARMVAGTAYRKDEVAVIDDHDYKILAAQTPYGKSSIELIGDPNDDDKPRKETAAMPSGEKAMPPKSGTKPKAKAKARE